MLRWTSGRDGNSEVRRHAADDFFLGVEFEPFTGASSFCRSKDQGEFSKGIHSVQSSEQQYSVILADGETREKRGLLVRESVLRPFSNRPSSL